MPNNLFDDGPYPIADQNSGLQRESLKQFKAAVPGNLFIVRDERADDYGVDLSLEVLRNGKAANLRSQVQLKANGEGKLNRNGSFSFSIPTSNLNYLLNGPCSLYVIWLDRARELRYAWARDEARRLHAENPDWGSQASVAILFRHRLDAAAWQAVHDRIIREARLNRGTHDAIIRASVPGAVSLSVDTQTLALTGPDEALAMVRDRGMGLSSTGYPQAVLQGARLIDPCKLDEPRVQLALGHATYSLGEHFTARGHLGRVARRRSELEAREGYFFDVMMLDCQHRFGQLSGDEYKARREEIEQTAPISIALQVQLEGLKRSHLREADGQLRSEWTARIRELVGRIEVEPTMNEAGRLMARLVQLYAEATDANLAILHTFGLTRARQVCGMNPLTAAIEAELNDAMRREGENVAHADACVEQARHLGNPILEADAVLTRAIILISGIQVKLSPFGNPGPHPVRLTEQQFAFLRDQVTLSRDAFNRASHIEQTVRADLVLADWMRFHGLTHESMEIAGQALNTVSAMGYTHYLKHAKLLASGTSEQAAIIAEMANPPDPDIGQSRMSDDDVRSQARFCLEMAELPADRLPNLERMAFAHRAIAREKMNWCQHIELHEELAHRRSPLTHYAVDPSRMCVCLRHKYESSIPHPDWEMVISAFKGAFCRNCPNRSPKQN